MPKCVPEMNNPLYDFGNQVFTAPVSGLYNFQAFIRVNTQSVWTAFMFRKNNVGYATKQFYSNAVNQAVHIDQNIYLNSGDTVDVYLYAGNGNVTTHAVGAGDTHGANVPTNWGYQSFCSCKLIDQFLNTARKLIP